MRNRTMTAIALVLAAPGIAAPLPDEVRLGAQIVRYVAAPADNALNMPTDVAVDARGHIVVADGVNHRIVRFDADGKLVDVVTAAGGAPLNQPVGVTFDPQNRLWIADTGGARLVIVSADGIIAEVIGVPAAGGRQSADVTDVLVTPDGSRAYVIDNDNHRLLIRDNANDTWQSMGRRGDALGQFDYPFMLALDGNGSLYVTDVINARVPSLGANDQWRGQIGRWGVEAGQFYRPKGIAVDSAGRIFVSDSTLGVVQAFESNGRLAGVLSDDAGEPLRFAHPMGMCFDDAGLLYVVELGENRVAIVKLVMQTDDGPEIGRGQIGGESER